MARKKVNVRKKKPIPFWIFAVFAAIVAVIGGYVGYNNYISDNPSAEAETYLKSYQAGKIVDKKLVPVERVTVRYVKGKWVGGHTGVFDKFISNGRAYTMRTKPNGPKVAGWEAPDSWNPDPDPKEVHPPGYNEGGNWVYLSKPIDIPKKKKIPVAIAVCWKALTGRSTAVKIQMRNIDGETSIRTSDRARESVVYSHSKETEERTREYGCVGLYDVIVPGKSQLFHKSSRKVRIWIKVSGKIQIGEIIVFTTSKPQPQEGTPDFDKRQSRESMR